VYYTRQSNRSQHANRDEARYWRRIAVFAYHTCIYNVLAREGRSRRTIAITFGMEKLERCGYPTVKNFEDTFCFDRIHERDIRQKTDGQTDAA